MSYARHDPNSMRRQSKLARKNEQAEQKKAAKLELRRQKEDELKRLKNLKKAEILEPNPSPNPNPNPNRNPNPNPNRPAGIAARSSIHDVAFG